MKRSLSILALLVLIGAIVDRSLPDQSGDLRGSAMGTGWHLRWRGDAPDREILRGEVAETLEKWEQVFSQWRDDSDLSRFNRGGKSTDELQRVIELAQEIKSQSSGAFDPGLLQETGEAGFGPEGVGVDLSGIGKGYAVDRVAEALTEAGLEDFLFELGGGNYRSRRGMGGGDRTPGSVRTFHRPHGETEKSSPRDERELPPVQAVRRRVRQPHH